MKELVKNIWFWLILALIAISIVVWRGCDQREEINQMPNLEYKTPEKTWEDEKGKVHSQITAENVTTSILDRVVDSLISENRNLRKAVSLTQVTVRVDTFWKEKIKWKDETQNEFEVTKKDDWIDLSVTGNLKTGESKISLKTMDTFSIVRRRKTHLFKPDETIIDFSSSSPYNNVQQMRSYSIPEKRVIVSFGPQAGVTYRNGKIEPYIGIGATLNIWGIKTRK